VSPVTHPRLRSFTCRVYEWLLHAYPEGYRTQFGRGMSYAFSRQLRDVTPHGIVTVLLFLCRSAFHALAFGVIERVAANRRSSKLRRPGNGEFHRPPRGHLFMDMGQEIRHAFRRLARSPGFSLTAALSLAVGIGANTAIFSLVNGVLLQPLPFEEPEQLVGVWNTAPGLDMEILPQSPAVNFTYVDECTTLDAVGLWSGGTVTVLGVEGQDLMPAVIVTAGTFQALRVRPAIGRVFSVEDDTPGTARTVILSYQYWQDRFGGDPAVVGQSLQINDLPREIIGVMPRGFRFLQRNPTVFLPYRFDRSSLFVGNFTFRSIARLKPGVTIEQATADMARLMPIAVEKFPGGMTLEILEDARGGPVLHPLKEDVVGSVGNVLWILLGTVGFILLIACANVANLFLVRAEGREREVAVRTAMGAGRGKVARLFLVESTTLGIIGGVLGLGIAHLGLRLLVATAPGNLPRLDEVSLNQSVLLFTAGISVLSGVVFGLFPALRFGRINLVSSLKEGGRAASSGRQRNRARNSLVVAQLALALVLLVGSGLMIRSSQALRNVNPGFQNPEEVLTLTLTIRSAEVPDAEEVPRTQELLVRLLEDLPEMESVGLSSSLPMDMRAGFDPVFVEDFPLAEGQLPPMRRFKWIGPGFAETLENPIVAGRSLTWADIHDRTRVVMVTENLAREYWGEPSVAIGKRVGTGLQPGDWREIVGVVGDVRDDGIAADPVAIVYWPMILEDFWADVEANELFVMRTMSFALRSSRVGMADFLTDIRQTIRSVNPNFTIADVRTMRDILDASMARTDFTLVTLGIAAAVALLLGTIGVYGVVSYVVSQRTREVGVRIALGAGTGQVTRMVLRQGMILAAVGVAVGLLSAYGLTRLMSALLFGVNPVDPLVYLVMSLGMTGVTLLASYLPARRAASTDPIEALRAE
jgi:putative ABC transport system permease protein